jgi:competence protein ComEA
MDELQKLPNIGPVLAQGIVNYRDSHGPFTRLEQIQNVSGIGPQTFEAMLPYITLGDQ